MLGNANGLALDSLGGTKGKWMDVVICYWGHWDC